MASFIIACVTRSKRRFSTNSLVLYMHAGPTYAEVKHARCAFEPSSNRLMYGACFGAILATHVPLARLRQLHLQLSAPVYVKVCVFRMPYHNIAS